MPNSFEILPEVFDNILECFLLVDKATRYMHMPNGADKLCKYLAGSCLCINIKQRYYVLCTLIENFPALIEKSSKIQSKIKRLVFVSVSTWTQTGETGAWTPKKRFSRDTDHILSCSLTPVQDFLTVKHIKFICNLFEPCYKILTYM